MTYADKLRIACKWKKMTHSELAKQAGISEKTVLKYITGETIPDVTTAIKLNDVIGMPLDYFFSDNLSSERDRNFTEIYIKIKEFIRQSKHENIIREQPGFEFIYDEVNQNNDN